MKIVHFRSSHRIALYDAYGDPQRLMAPQQQQQIMDRNELLLLQHQGLLQQQQHYQPEQTFHHRFPQPVPHFSDSRSPDKMLLDPREEGEVDGGCDSRWVYFRKLNGCGHVL